MRQVKDILSTVITNELSLNLKFKSVTTNPDGHYVCECENTQYLNVGKTVVIDGVTYRVEAFTFNSSLTLSGASAPTAGLVYPIAKPTFVFGKYKDVHAQVAAMNIKDSMPMIWMFELLERSQPEDELSSIDSEGDVRLYFFNSMQNDWETSDHYTEVFDPLTNLIDAFVNACKASPLLGEIGRVARTNHAKFATGGQTISGGDERQIMPAYLSAIEVLIGIPVLSYCGALPDTACAPGNLLTPSGQLITQIPSGGSYTIDAGSGGAVRNSDSSYTNTVASGGTLVLPDIQVTDSDGSTRNVPSVQDVVCSPAADATVENSDSSYTSTVASGGTLILPDITVTDSDGSTFTQASVVNVVCSLAADGTVNVNSVFFDNVASGGTLNIEVTQSSGSTLIGSKQGAYFRIPDSVITLDNTDGTTLSTTNVLATDASTITAPDATAVIKNTLNAVLRSELIPSNVSEDIIIGDATININKSDGTLIASATVTAEGSGVYSVADSTVNVVNTLGTVLSSNLVKATETDNVLAPDANVENSDGSYLNTVASGGTLILPDITVTDSDGSTSSFPSVKNVTCSPAANATVENSDQSYTNTVASGGTLILPDITVTDSDGTTSSFPSVKNVVCTPGTPTLPLITLYKRPTKPHQLISYDTYDAGWQLANGVYNNFNQTTASGVQVRTQILDFATDSTGNTLMYNNPFGNKDRWTDENGLQIYGNNVAIDNLSGIRWVHDIQDINFRNDLKLYSTLLSDAVAYTDPLGNSDYYVPPREIIMTLPIIDFNGSTIEYTAALTPNGFTGNHWFISSTTGVNYTLWFYRVALRNRAQVSFFQKSGNDFRNFAVVCAILPQPITPNP